MVTAFTILWTGHLSCSGKNLAIGFDPDDEKERDKLGYHRIGVGCGKYLVLITCLN